MSNPRVFSPWQFSKDLRSSPSLLFFAFFFVLQGLDISKDYAEVAGVALRDWAIELNCLPGALHYYMCAAFLISTLSIVAFKKTVYIPKALKPFLILICAFVGVGLLAGLIGENDEKLVLLEASTWMFYLALPFFVFITRVKKAWRSVYTVLLIYTVIIMAKTLVSFIVDFYSHIAYLKVFVRGNFFLIPLFFTLILLAVYKKKWVYLFSSIFLLITIILTGMRGNFLGVIVGSLYLLIFYRKSGQIYKYLFAGLLVVMSFVIIGEITGLPLNKLLGFWGDTFENGLNYRLTQFHQLLQKFIESPFWGKGFGLVLYDYEGFADTLVKPYLQELEWMNFIAKTGLIGGLSLVGAFVMLLKWINKVSYKARTDEQKFILQGLACGLVAMLTATLSNTLISSILFHLYVFCVVSITAGVASESEVDFVIVK
ncbi:MAG: hypothetical protein A2X26_13225 [Chloroflexi bacterium GWC2_49_37]|nr:MAG: hypothetical protein A2X26_13225 [Chloroflexi bacterium GWC2_49_37]